MNAARATAMTAALLLAVVAGPAAAQAGGAPAAAAVPAPRIVGDGIPQPLTDRPGDPARGRAIVGSRTQGMCLLCHEGPRELFPQEPTPGTVAGSLAGAGARWSAAQLRLRIVDARRLQPDTPMPAYHRVDPDTEDSRRVAAAWRGRPIFDAQQVEDVVAFLGSLR